MRYSIEKVTTLIGARRIGEADANIGWLLTDSRSLCFPEETLFFALRSERNDGHKYICELYRRRENPAANIGITFMGVVYVALPFSLMCYIPIIGSETWSPWMMIFYVFIIWANDVFAYLVGMSVGRHRLCERLSPKKSWEGFFGGIAGAVVLGLVAARVMDGSCWVWAGLALVCFILPAVLSVLFCELLRKKGWIKEGDLKL